MNPYRQKAASGGRVESVEDKVQAASQGKLKAEKPSFSFGASAIPAAGATRQTPLPKPQGTGSPVQPASITKASSGSSPVAPHGTEGIKQEYKKATGEDY